MKKTIVVILIAGLFVGLVAVAGFFGVTKVLAQTPQPTDTTPYWGGMMGGMMGRTGDGYGYMHEYMEEALAEKLGITVEELEAKFEAGDTMWQIVVDQGYTEEEAWTILQEARSDALDAMVADGVITSDQADYMKDRMSQMQQYGGCSGMGGGFRGGGMMRGNRWNQNQE